MSGYQSKRSMSNDRQYQALGVIAMTAAQAELAMAMQVFSSTEALEQWQASLPLTQRQTVDSLIMTVMLEQFDHVLAMSDDYNQANQYLSKFRLNQ